MLNYNFFIRIGSYPTVGSHSGTWVLNASTHSLDWSIPLINSEDNNGTLEFSIGGDDVSSFFPVSVAFIAQGSLIDISVLSVARADTGDNVDFSQDITLSANSYQIV